MKRIFSLLMVLLLSLSACGGQQKWELPEGPLVWFVSDEPALWGQVAEGESIHGPALAAETYEGDMNAEALVTALLSGPEGEGLRSPFPKGLSAVSYTHLDVYKRQVFRRCAGGGPFTG